MKYSALKPLLEDLEKKWFQQLLSSLPAIRPHLRLIANGYAQFFSVEHFAKDAPLDEDLPVIVALGINYDQGLPHLGFPATKHWLSSQPPGPNWVEDPPPWKPSAAWPSSTRRMLDLNLAQYFLNQSVWKSNVYASDTGLLPRHNGADGRLPYILVCTNFSPFLTRQCWTDHDPILADQLLAEWIPSQHLCDLLDRCGNGIDLWVAHGKEAVWPRFNRSCKEIPRWLMTHNLSPRTTRYVSTFWSRRNTVSPGPTVWPTCPCSINKTTVLEEPVDC